MTNNCELIFFIVCENPGKMTTTKNAYKSHVEMCVGKFHVVKLYWKIVVMEYRKKGNDRKKSIVLLRSKEVLKIFAISVT